MALSFVREPKDLRLVRNLIEWAGEATPVIAKIEKPQALAHLDEILEAADAVMVARGDLGVELSPAEVRPTRAEASDVANAVLDGSDAVMLSGETAVGRYPVEAVAMMAQIIERAEAARRCPCRSCP